jgi:hypothetical protein
MNDFVLSKTTQYEITWLRLFAPNYGLRLNFFDQKLTHGLMPDRRIDTESLLQAMYP